MKIWDIAKKFGSVALQTALPGTGTAIVSAVNAFMPDGQKLPENATGDQLTNAIEALPPEQRVAIMDKQFDVQITDIKESNETLRTMLIGDAKNPHSTRPRVVWWAFVLVAMISGLIAIGWVFAVFTGNAELVKAITDGWPFVAALLAPFIGWLNNYFGTLRKEAKDRLDAYNGITSEKTTMIKKLAAGILNQ